MIGDEARIHEEWLRLIGDPEWTPPDFSNNWPVRFGEFVETFALDWHEQKTQKELTKRGASMQHPTRPYVACTLDAYRPFDDTVIDCKTSGSYRPLDEILAHYTPQLIVQRACVGAERAALLVVHGSAEPVELEIHLDAAYEAVVWQRVDEFWQCVQDMRPPVPLPTITPPDKWRTINLELERDAHNWAGDMIQQLVVWDATHDDAKKFEEAAKLAKQLLPEDVGRVLCGAVTITRARNRAVTIRRAKA